MKESKPKLNAGTLTFKTKPSKHFVLKTNTVQQNIDHSDRKKRNEHPVY